MSRKRQWGIGRAGLAALLLTAVSTLVAAPAAGASAFLPPGNHIFAGLTGGKSITRFWHAVGKHPPVFEDYLTYNTSSNWLSVRDPNFRARLGIELSTSKGYGQAGVISPRRIADGGADAFLVRLNHNLAHSGRVFYVRIMGEMDAWWNAYSAYNADGSYRGAANSPQNFIQAWRRTVLILRGGPVAAVNRRLRALGLPKLKAMPGCPGGRHSGGCRTALARPKVAFLWVPQDAGSPQIAADSPGVYWPGPAYVDWVGTDFYSFYPNFSMLSDFYSQFSSKPFVISEWAVDGADDASFVHQLFSWVMSHPRVRMINYYEGFTSSSPANLAHYPASRAALKRELRSKRFEAYPPEYAGPHKHRKHQPPEAPPVPAQPGQPPSPPLPPPTSTPAPPPTSTPTPAPPTPTPPSPPPICLLGICVPL